MTNANDITAKYYDLTSGYFKNEQVLTEELELISQELQTKGTVLDIGCGTGRHLIPLLKKGYAVTGIDSSAAMLKILQSKNNSAKVILTSFYDYQTENKYDLCILFWNAFNEIALNDEQANAFFDKCHKLLNYNGKIIINIDDATILDVANLKFSFIISQPEILEYFWNVDYFDKATNTTISSETIVATNQKICTQITQKWWYTKELVKFAQANNFNCEIKHINSNNELYLVFTKDGK